MARALRRQSYELSAEGRFDVEYADMLGIPLDFAAEPVVVSPTRPRRTVRAHAVRPERDALTIEFPRVEGYSLPRFPVKAPKRGVSGCWAVIEGGSGREVHC